MNDANQPFVKRGRADASDPAEAPEAQRKLPANVFAQKDREISDR